MQTEQEKAFLAEFHYQMVLNPSRSVQAGRQVFDDILYLRLQARGLSTSVVDREAREADKYEYPAAWARWQAQNEQPAVGTPIAYLPGITPSVDHFFRQIGIRTVEGVAQAGDAQLNGLKIGAALRIRARAFLAALNAAPIEAQQPEGEEPDIQRDVKKVRRAGAGTLN